MPHVATIELSIRRLSDDHLVADLPRGGADLGGALASISVETLCAPSVHLNAYSAVLTAMALPQAIHPA
jgi:hypothetical protein